MSQFSNLVNMKFEDATSYASSFTNDILVVPFFHPWGPALSFETLQKTDFFEKYKESLPMGLTADADYWEALTDYVNIKRAFDSGIGRVLAIRVPSKQAFFTIESTAFKTTWDSVAPSDLCFSLKYPGFPTVSDLNGQNASSLSITLSYDNSAKTIKVKVQATGSDSPIEEFEGSTIYGHTTSGEPDFIDDIVNNNSALLANFSSETLIASGLTSTDLTATVSASLSNLFSKADYLAKCKSLYENELADPDVTKFNLALVPAPWNTDVTVSPSVLRSAVNQCVATRKDCNALMGYKTTGTFTLAEARGTDPTSWKSFQTMVRAYEPTFFSLYIFAREYYYCLGHRYTLDGTSAWAGRIANVAENKRLNQMPSARVYGMLNATLAATLTFNEVLELHEEGCNSIYLSTQGPCIFGIKTAYFRQTSYWAKANISRVTARIVQAIYPEVMNVIHTEVTSDPIERAKYTANLNAILSQFKASKDIKDESYVITDDTVNSDSQTNGGEILNTVLVIYYKKLTERVNIKFIATDSSVTVSIS